MPAPASSDKASRGGTSPRSDTPPPKVPLSTFETFPGQPQLNRAVTACGPRACLKRLVGSGLPVLQTQPDPASFRAIASISSRTGQEHDDFQFRRIAYPHLYSIASPALAEAFQSPFPRPGST